jgi:hypothetical protein
MSRGSQTPSERQTENRCAPTEDVAADRQAVIQKAISKSDLADAVRFALTVDQKWGDTDPEGIASNWEDTDHEV